MQLMYFLVLKFYNKKILNFHNNKKNENCKIKYNYFDISILNNPKIKPLFIIKC